MKYFVFYGNAYLYYVEYSSKEEALEHVTLNYDDWDNIFVIEGKELTITKSFGFKE